MVTENELIELKTECVIPLLECPKGRSRQGCPFAAARALDIVESINWLKGKSANELRAFLANHKKCETR